jgi:hypothetical protein
MVRHQKLLSGILVFNIYIEDLFKEICTNKRLVHMENILAYADDVLVLCNGHKTLKDVIETIETWSQDNGMVLNKKKSAIVEFLPRHHQLKHLQGRQILGIPVEEKYKYLRLWLNQKLTLDDQIEHIRRKSDFMKTKLGPVLTNCSLGYP